MSDLQVVIVAGAVPTGRVSARGFGLMPAGPIMRPALGGAYGIHYGPDLNDTLLLGKGPGGYDVAIGYLIDPNTNLAIPSLMGGEILLNHKSGSSVKLTAAGDIILTPAPGRTVLLGDGTGAVGRVGDSVSVSGSVGSGGGAFTATGTITSGSPKVRA